MKHDELRTIAHNIADSLASGVGLPIGYHETDIFAESKTSPQGFITVDFLNGTLIARTASQPLQAAVCLYRNVLHDICAKHTISPSSFKKLEARFFMSGIEKLTHVTTEDAQNRTSEDKYTGIPLKRIKTLDSRGRVRT